MASYDRFPLQGSLDTATPYLTRQPGSLLACSNFVPETDGGYIMEAGYERYDGQPAPSDVIVYNLRLNGSASAFVAGTTVTGSPSGAVAIVGRAVDDQLWVDVINGIEFQPGDTVGARTVNYITTEDIDARSYDPTAPRTNIIIITVVTGPTSLAPGDELLGLTSGATVRVDKLKYCSGNSWAYCTYLTGQPLIGETLHKADGTDYKNNFAYDVEPMLSDPNTPASVYFYLSEMRRGKIKEVPGAGPVRGVWDLEGLRYAFRNNVANTAVVMYKSSPTGWVAVNLGFTLKWNSRPTTIFDTDLITGDVIKGATSNATATVGWVGYVAQDHSTGYVSLKTITGTFAAGENLVNQTNGKTIGKVESPATANVLPVNGTYRFTNHNFYGGIDAFALYGVNGVSNGFTYNEQNGFCFIPTAADVDLPFDVCEYKDHLFYALPNASCQHSVVGSPLDWSGGLGALAFGVGAEISSLIPSPKSLIICTEKDIQSLQGDGYDTWVKQVITQHTGISKFTGLYQSQSFVLAQAGIVSLDRTGSFGDFSDSVISDTIRTLLVPNYARCTCAMARKSRGQYRLHFEGDLNISLSTNQGNLIGFSTFDYGGLTIRQAVNPYGDIYFISDTGFVYHDAVGASNDGAERISTFRTSFATQGDPDTRKRYRRMDMNVRATSFINARLNFTYNKGSSTPGESIQSGLITSGGGRWDLSLWNQVYWDATESPTISSDIDGIAFDISTMVFVSSRIHPQFTCEDLSIEWSPRRKVR